jgi:hypothetical protein
MARSPFASWFALLLKLVEVMKGAHSNSAAESAVSHPT